jgi:hypothetical protein
MPSHRAEHFVYIYRDRQGKPRYVGYGQPAERSISHMGESHNPRLNSFIRNKWFRIEIAGPYESETTGLAVETGLISTLKPDLNDHRGKSDWRFRPIGLPARLAKRWTQRALNRRNFLTVQGSRAFPVLFVRVTESDLPDGRIGYRLENPPSDREIRERVEKWWVVGRYLSNWARNPECSPGLLIGVYGRPGAQFVIASMRIDRSNWDNVESRRGGGRRIPLLRPNDIDAFILRGRRISRTAKLTFGNRSNQSFILLGRNCVTQGGLRR